jgi:lysophospholipase L1-like esterase
MGTLGTNRLARRPALAALLAAPLLVAAAPSASSAVSAPTRYVALGDSYTSAPLIGPFAGEPLGCFRSVNNYPHLVQQALQAASFTDMSCGGATTDNLTAAQPVLLGTNPPQLSALSPDTDVVTAGIGGNDLGFSSIILSCVSALPIGAPCQQHYVTGGVDQLAAAIAATAPKIATALRGVHRLAPLATVFLVGYPDILPEHFDGCWPILPFTPSDVAYLRATEKRMNRMLADQAAANAATYVDTYTSSVGHDACQLPGTRWVEGIVPTAPALPVHPNALGERDMARQVLAAMLRAGLPVGAGRG